MILSMCSSSMPGGVPEGFQQIHFSEDDVESVEPADPRG